jgi:hypothetical protein
LARDVEQIVPGQKPGLRYPEPDDGEHQQKRQDAARKKEMLRVA